VWIGVKKKLGEICIYQLWKIIFARQLINLKQNKEMKKVFFAFVAASVVVLSACNNKPAETAPEATADTTTVSTAVETVTTDSTTMTTTTTDTTVKK
jgi:hypothetical protein